MARRKRKEEEPGWSPPEFDEVDFMRREISGAKASTVVVAWAAIGALVAYGIIVAGVHWALAFLVGLFAFAGLYFVMPYLGIPSETYKRRDWIGHGTTYFFSWLAFWILLLNAPFGDFTNPAVGDVLAGSFPSSAVPTAGTLVCRALQSSPLTVPTGSNDTLYVVFRVTDNVRIASVTVRVTPGSDVPFDANHTLVAGQPRICAGGPTTYAPGTYEVRLTTGPSSFGFLITGVDTAGHTASLSFVIN